MPADTARRDALARLRQAGWTVAVHNDYRLGGQSYTFWLLTHPCGRWVKGEGSTDDGALAECERQIERRAMDDRPPQPYAVRVSGNDGGPGCVTLMFDNYAAAEKWWKWADGIAAQGIAAARAAGEAKDG